MASGGCNSVVVWQWWDRSDWVIYEPLVSNFLEKSRDDRKRCVCLGDIFDALKNYEVDVTAMYQRNITKGYLRYVRRLMLGNDSALAKGIAWEWLDDSKWHFYSLAAMDLLEAGHTGAQATIDLSAPPCGLPYQVDLKQLQQVNVQSGFSRPVRRRQLVPVFSVISPTVDSSTLSRHTSAPHPGLSSSASPAPKRSIVPRLLKRRKDKDKSRMGCSSSLPQRPSAEILVEDAVEADIAKLGNLAVPVGVEVLGKPANPFEIVSGFCDTAKLTKEDESEECPICTEPLSEPSSCEAEGITPLQQSIVFSLRNCKHLFHAMCLKAMREASKELCLRCPICKTIHGIHTGNQPEGMMIVRWLQGPVPGYEGHNTLEVSYHIRPGIQGPNHPNPGQPYTCRAFPRVTFFPDNDEGRKVVSMLRVAWERRLIFTIGMSATTGEEDTVTWNEIHHKTSWKHNDNGHGYPDPNYLFNVQEELKEQGITLDDVHRQLL